MPFEGACNTSGLRSASATIKTQSGKLYGLVLIGGSVAATLVLYDSISATGTVLCKCTAAAGVTVPIVFNKPIPFKTGIYANVAGTGAEYIIYYV